MPTVVVRILVISLSLPLYSTLSNQDSQSETGPLQIALLFIDFDGSVTLRQLGSLVPGSRATDHEADRGHSRLCRKTVREADRGHFSFSVSRFLPNRNLRNLRGGSIRLSRWSLCDRVGFRPTAEFGFALLVFLSRCRVPSRSRFRRSLIIEDFVCDQGIQDRCPALAKGAR